VASTAGRLKATADSTTCLAWRSLQKPGGKHGETPVANCENPWEKSRENMKIMGKPWGKTMATYETHGKTMGKTHGQHACFMEKVKKHMGKIDENRRTN